MRPEPNPEQDYTWAVLKADGLALEGTGSPKEHLGEPGEVLVVCRDDAAPVVVAPSSEGRIHWLTTVDRSAITGELIRRLAGPGIASPNPVRLWFSRSGALYLTDGPIEGVFKAQERIRAAQEGGS